MSSQPPRLHRRILMLTAEEDLPGKMRRSSLRAWR